MAKRKAGSRTRKAARPQKKKNAAARKARPAKKSAKRPAKRPIRRAAARKPAKASKPVRRPARTAARRVAKSSRPKPPALQRERRRLREDETVAGAPSTLGYAPKASSAESGQAALHHRLREHTEGGSTLTAGDVDADWNDAEELKGADKILERDRHRWEYDPASAEDYKDRNKK
ncbi:MAG: hypothetical protein EXQ55_01005 [Acidobacteria bacterium]|nr:hypothetical protein [Acidobacteriota bacterium]